MNLNCIYCQEPVDPRKPGEWTRVTGWTQKRRGGGTNAVSLVESLGQYAHDVCMKEQRLDRQAKELGARSLFDE